MRFEPGDIVFTNARVVDGTGAPARDACVHVRAPLIHAVFSAADLSAAEQAQLTALAEPAKPAKQAKPAKPAEAGEQADARVRVVDCTGLVLAPGFIDMHAHSDLGLMHTPAHLAKITQGVTTEVIGQDGIGYAPVDDVCLPMIRAQIAGWNGNPADAAFWAWRSMREYLDVLDARKPATNAAVLVPQGNLRMLVLGYDPREATPAEIAQMQRILTAALEDGAVGMSSGLTYVPGMYAPDSELAALLPIVAQHGGYYSPHHRSYGKGALRAYEEMIDLAERTRVRLHLTHAILNFDENRGKAAEFLAMLQRARARGVVITLDTYPYLPGSTTLAAQLPSWCAAGGPADTLQQLEDADVIEKIRYDVEVVGTDGCHGCTIDWDTIEISGVRNPRLVPIVGRTLGALVRDIEAVRADDTAAPDAQAAVDALGLPCPEPQGFDVMVRVLLEDELGTAILQHVGHEENVRAIMADEGHCGGSDGILTSTKPHPRAWGTFTRYLGHYARELPAGRERDIYDAGALETYKDVPPTRIFAGLEDAVAHLTSRPAAVLRLTDRGVIAPGKRADIIVFDAATIRDNSTFAFPTRPSQGIRFLLVNGRFAIDEGEPTHARAGQTIRLRASDDSSSGWAVS